MEHKAGDRRVLIIKDEKGLFPCEVEYPFRWCPAGTFMMGSPATEAERHDDEMQHQVTLTRGFWILETQVTQAMWEIVMGNNPSYFKGNEKLPVECVSWDDCREYVRKLDNLGIAPEGYRFSLPTEAQWEYACRAGTTTPFNFGTTLNGDNANCCGYYPYGTSTNGNDLEKTIEVGSYLANAWGLYDMHGNVGEWCLDCYGDYPSDSVTDPVAVSSDDNAYRVFRGGSYFDAAECCRSASRDGDNFEPWEPDAFNGFRPVLICTEAYSENIIIDRYTPIDVLEQEAERGNACSQYFLGMSKYYGMNVSKDKDEGTKWLCRAAEQGHEEATETLQKIKDSHFPWEIPQEDIPEEF